MTTMTGRLWTGSSHGTGPRRVTCATRNGWRSLTPVLRPPGQSQLPRLRPRVRKLLNKYRLSLSGQDRLRPDRLSRTQL